MNRFLSFGALFTLTATIAFHGMSAEGQTPAAKAPPAEANRVLLDKYCVGCHNSRAKTGGIALDSVNLAAAPADAQLWEKALRKLRGRQMPPPGTPQPAQKDV